MPLSDSTDAAASSAAEADFTTEVDRMLLAVRFLSELDLAGIVRVVGLADALGPFLDPTAYRDSLYRRGNMHDVAALARHALPLVECFKEIADVAE